MYKFFLTIVILALNTAGFAEDIVTTDGNNYKNVQVRQTTPLGITGTVTENGQEQACWIPYSNMSPSNQQKYGYDKAKADEFVAKLNANKSQLDDGTVVSSPKSQIKEKSIQIPKDESNNPNNPIQGNQFRSNGASGVTPVIAGGINPTAVAVATPGAGVSVAPSGIGINTPIGNIGVSPNNIGVQTPICNLGVSPNCIGVQTPIAAISVNAAPVAYQPTGYYPPQYVVYQQPVVTSFSVQPAPVVYNDGNSQWIVYGRSYVPYTAYYNQYWASNWAYNNGVWYPAPYFFQFNFGWGSGWYNSCGYRGRYYAGNCYWNGGRWYGGRGYNNGWNGGYRVGYNNNYGNRGGGYSNYQGGNRGSGHGSGR